MAEEGYPQRSPLDADAEAVRQGLDQMAGLLGEVAATAEQLLIHLVTLRRSVDALAVPAAAHADAVAERDLETQRSHPPAVPRSGKGGRPRKAIDVDRAYARRVEGWSYRQIAREFGVGEATLRARMKSGNRADEGTDRRVA